MALKDLIVDQAEKEAMKICCDYSGYLFPAQVKKLQQQIATAIRAGEKRGSIDVAPRSRPVEPSTRCER